MAAVGKRKANDVDHNGFYSDDRRPTLKRRGTSASQMQMPSQACNLMQTTNQDEQQRHGRNDSAMSSYDAHQPAKEEEEEQHQQQHQTLLPTPPNSASLTQDGFTSTSPSPTTSQPHPSPSPLPFQSLLTTFCHLHGPTFGPRYLPSLQTSHSHATSSTSQPSVVLAAGQAFTSTLRAYIEDLQAAALAQVQLRAQLSSIGVEKVALEAVDAVLARLDEQMSSIMAQAQSLELGLSVLQEGMRSQSREVEIAML